GGQAQETRPAAGGSSGAQRGGLRAGPRQGPARLLDDTDPGPGGEVPIRARRAAELGRPPAAGVGWHVLAAEQLESLEGTLRQRQAQDGAEAGAGRSTGTLLPQ